MNVVSTYICLANEHYVDTIDTDFRISPRASNHNRIGYVIVYA